MQKDGTLGGRSQVEGNKKDEKVVEDEDMRKGPRKD
jgi:hypothetical protein